MAGYSWRRFAGLAGVVVLASCNAAAAPSGTIDFTRDIRPILSDNCFACHGPDEKSRKAKLRLDLKEEALKPAKSDAIPIVPGDLAASELIVRVTTSNEDDLMPPPKSGKKLTAQQIDLLKRWVQQGAPWQEHWAFIPPRRPSLPQTENTKWARNPIDRFVLARIEKENLKPSPPANKTTLIRRATLDLTGLPPTPEEVDAFLADRSDDAYEKVVDRLLESPRYGEQMARYWMDAVRYADSHGYHIDSERSIWKYREWVINAFNENKPFDQFTIEQLAGDLLPEPSLDQKIATGYVRCNMTTGEGGAIEEEYKAKYTFDRVETTSTVWMGLTMTCARCHTHKYDPITQKEYYQLYAFFNSLDEPVMDKNRPNPDPFMKLPTPEQAERQEWLKASIAKAEKKLDEPMPELDEAQLAWQAEWHEKLSSGWANLKPDEVTSTNGTEFEIGDGGAVVVRGPNPEQDIHEVTLQIGKGTLAGLRLEVLPHDSTPKKSASRADDGVFRLSEFEAEIVEPPAEEGKESKPKKLKFSQAVADVWAENYDPARAIDGKADTGWSTGTTEMSEPHTALFLLREPMTLEADTELRVRLRYEASRSRRAIAHFRLAASRNEQLVRWLNPPKLEPWKVIGPFKSPGLEAGFTNEYEPEKVVDLKKTYPGVREEIRWNTRGDFEDGKANVLVQYLHGINGVYYLYRELEMPEDRKMEVSLRADDLFKLWANGELVAERKTREKLGEGPLKATISLKKGKNKLLIKVVNHQGECTITFNKDLNERDTLPAEVAAVLATTGAPAGEGKKKVRDHFRRLNSPEWKTLADEMAQWRDENNRIEKAIPTTMIAKESEKPTETVMLVRGEYDKKGDVVTRGVPSILPPFPADAPTNRLGLARWLVSTNHPLTARVTVNRFWQQFFGVGLVKTTEDFGVQSEAPSHPELLDWLATEFMSTGWDMKRLHRLIVTSATYRQSSEATPAAVAHDPENRLLARGPRFRVDAEVVRDTALAVSGLLVERVGGRSVKPYEPPGLWEAVSFNNSQKYVPDKDDGQYRRSLYTFWKRQSPPPNMLLFDAPTREYCVVKRPRTNTPLQALALMNDPQFVEASRGLARRMMLEGGEKVRDRIVFGFRLATARKPSRDEIAILREVLKAQREEFRRHPEAAKKLLKVGSFQADASLDDSELAAWTAIASMILNLDETITKS